MYQFEFSGNYIIVRCQGVVVTAKQRDEYSSDQQAREKITEELLAEAG